VIRVGGGESVWERAVWWGVCGDGRLARPSRAQLGLDSTISSIQELAAVKPYL
jgi:hypothetical protein